MAKEHALGGEAVELRGADGDRPVGAEVAVAEVVEEDQDQIWAGQPAGAEPGDALQIGGFGGHPALIVGLPIENHLGRQSDDGGEEGDGGEPQDQPCHRRRS